MPITLNGDTGITTPSYGGVDVAEYIVPVTAFKNRIINGAMMIDQRNAGAAVAYNNSGGYVLDRWFCEEFTDGAVTFARSTDAPTGFYNSLVMTVTTADTSIGATQYAAITQHIEGNNVADFMLGTANAVTFTVSFWIKSSVTGFVNCTLQNGNGTRLFPTAVNITVANTWEYKTITVAGDTTGTWGKDNGKGLSFQVYPVLGSTFVGASGWNASNIFGTQTSSNVMATVGNTLYITGVQLEKGSTATSFDYRPYGTELALCQRYAYTTSGGCSNAGAAASTTTVQQRFNFPVVMRATPTTSITLAGSFGISDDYNADATATTVTITQTRASTIMARLTLGGFTGLTTGRLYGGVGDTGTAQITFASEL